MAYASTPEDIRRARLLGVFYIIMAVALAYMLFKIWPPVPWPTSEHLQENPAMADALKKSLEECSPSPSPSPTPRSTLPATSTPTTPPQPPGASVTPTGSPTVALASSPSPESVESPADTESAAQKEVDKVVSQALVGNIPIKFFGWCVSTTFDERLIMLVIIAGMLGSFVHGATSLADYIGNNNFNRSWTWFYLLRPSIGMSLALVFYFVVRGGFLTTSGSAQDINPYGIAALSGLVGMFSKQATDKLGEVFSTLFRAAEGEGDAKRSGSLNPEPLTVTSVDPTSVPAVPAGGPNQPITVNGSGFAADSMIYVNNAAQVTTFVSGTQLTGELDVALLAAPATLNLKVVNADGTESPAVDFTVT